MAKKAKIGDVIEIKTAKGLAYAQYTHKIPRWGPLIRVLPGFHATRPGSFAGIVSERTLFVVFFPLQQALNLGIFDVVANADVPDFAAKFPLFRAAGHVDREGKVHFWWLWDGVSETRVDTLSREQRKLPIRAAWNDTLLVERIEEQWTPETDSR
jgi:hypothetical protein